MADHAINIFKSGVHNMLDPEITPEDSASDAQNWYTADGRIILSNGRALLGAEGVAGSVTGESFGYKSDGTKVHWRKIGTKIQYLNGTTWTDTVTGLTSTADYTFPNYSSLAGTFTFAVGADGIYKFHNANPGSSIALYSSATNFKGLALIDKGRMILWNEPNSKTILYCSKKDYLTYTTVTNEIVATGDGVLTSFSGTLAFKGGNPLANCFNITVNTNPASVTATEGTPTSLGVITGTGVTGTINYITGAWALTFSAPVALATTIRISYQWENSNVGGVTDFTHATPRVASEGNSLNQSEGGDPIMKVEIGQDGKYYSMKNSTVYSLDISTDDLTFTNLVYRKDIGMPSQRGSVSTNKGIVFINTANPSKPELTILQRNPIGDNIEPINLFPQFKFSNYTYEDATLDTFNRFVVLMCRTTGTAYNDIILLMDTLTNTVDITKFSARTSAKDAGHFYIGSSITQTVYDLYNGYDDDGLAIDNFWVSKIELFKTENLKRYKRLRLKGRISPEQNYSVYANYDDAGFQLVGTVRGDGTYVDGGGAITIGSAMVGSGLIGGDTFTNIYPYFIELHLKTGKFRSRQLKFVANGIGYVDIDTVIDRDIWLFENKLPKRFRSKQNVSLNGQNTDQANPTF
jgi:hypothetical protein